MVETHFLKPYVTSTDGAVAELPHHRLCVSSSDLKESFSRISFNGFWSAHRNFKSWTKKMEALHEPTWRKAGIFEAIKASIYKIPKNQSLILPLVEKWCPETKSFVFPWGEATITLEDVMVLLGFSVLGSPVFAPLESSEMRDSVEKLEKARFENRGKDGQVRKRLWISSFLGRGDQMEHEAFLALWLSQFVFPDMSRRSISKKVLPIAVRLARGERIALAPAVLSRLYRDLGQIQAFAREKSTQNVTLKSLFKLVQVWTWERFKSTSPKARVIPKGEPRIARWHSQTSVNVRLNLDDCDWRPYTKPLKNWNPPRFYPEEAMWITVDDNLDDEFVSFARCMRVSQLVGIGIVEDYYPNRVAMQFGLAQDLPGLVTDHSSFTEKEAWDDYNKTFDGSKLYIPSRLATTSVTERYQDWWLKSISKFLDSSESTETFNASNTVDHYDDEDDELLPLAQVLQKSGESFLRKLKRCRRRKLAKNQRFEIKKDKIGDGGASASTELPLSQLFKKKSKNRTSEHLKNKGRKRAREDDESSMDNKDDEENYNITIAQMIKSIRNDESGSKAKKSSMVQRPSNENNSSDPLVDSNGGIIDIAVSPPKTRQTCDDDLHVDGSKKEECLVLEDREKQRSNETNSSDPLVDSNGGITDIAVSLLKTSKTCDGKLHVNRSKEEECLVHEDGEKQRSNESLCSEAEKEEDIDERLKQRKLAIEDIALKLETRVMKVEKSLAMIRKWKTKGNQTNYGVSA
ncbi:Aminotransferase-like plant mobile domain [Arabidopsis suecica]|uniref:Aminotransferase-like plant mobile domain n=1 Tax=Arabidopsis suecica TaxID=45249 RepID=A0A8T2CIJ5_ARASU|nr:Aminotransferase-like plant mobile domain [Arabidopsis suecica]